MDEAVSRSEGGGAAGVAEERHGRVGFHRVECVDGSEHGFGGFGEVGEALDGEDPQSAREAGGVAVGEDGGAGGVVEAGGHLENVFRECGTAEEEAG